jgi:hypothetical protein
MNRNNGYFWLGLAPYWLRVATAIGTVATALPALQRIDRIMISGDWAAHGPELWAGIGSVGIAVVVLLAGLALADAARLALDRMTSPVLTATRAGRIDAAAQPPAAPLPNSRALLQSLGIGPAPAAVTFHSPPSRDH